MFKDLAALALIAIWLFSQIASMSSERLANKDKPVLPAFYGINIYHRVRDRSKPKPIYGPPSSKLRILNPKPIYGPPKHIDSFGKPSPACDVHHSVAQVSDEDYDIPKDYDVSIKDYTIPKDYEQDLTPPHNQGTYGHSSMNGHNNNNNEDLHNLVQKRPEFFENYSAPQKENSYEGHNNFEELQIPTFNNPPLLFDPTRSSYDTPGAVTSYGTPIQKPQNNFQHNVYNEGNQYQGFNQNQNNYEEEEYNEDNVFNQQVSNNYGNNQNHHYNNNYDAANNPFEINKYYKNTEENVNTDYKEDYNEKENINESYPNLYEIFKTKEPAAFSKDVVKYSVQQDHKPKIEDYFAVNFNVDFLNNQKKRGIHEVHAGNKLYNYKSAKLTSNTEFEEIRYPNHRYEI